MYLQLVDLILIRIACPINPPAADGYCDRLFAQIWIKLMVDQADGWCRKSRAQWCAPFLSTSRRFRDTGKKLFQPVSLRTKRQIAEKRYYKRSFLFLN